MNSPSTNCRPIASSPSASKNVTAASRSPTVIPTWSNRCMCPMPGADHARPRFSSVVVESQPRLRRSRQARPAAHQSQPHPHPHPPNANPRGTHETTRTCGPDLRVAKSAAWRRHSQRNHAGSSRLRHGVACRRGGPARRAGTQQQPREAVGRQREEMHQGPAGEGGWPGPDRPRICWTAPGQRKPVKGREHDDRFRSAQRTLCGRVTPVEGLFPGANRPVWTTDTHHGV